MHGSDDGLCVVQGRKRGCINAMNLRQPFDYRSSLKNRKPNETDQGLVYGLACIVWAR
jgi:hypothetical protein